MTTIKKTWEPHIKTDLTAMVHVNVPDNQTIAAISRPDRNRKSISGCLDVWGQQHHIYIYIYIFGDVIEKTRHHQMKLRKKNHEMYVMEDVVHRYVHPDPVSR